MIRVNIDRERATGRIAGFRVDGHALFAESGKDIVCAGVSAVTVGAVNAAERVARVELTADMDSGKLHVSVPDAISQEQQHSLQIVLDSMVVMLQTIEQSYGAYIRLQEHYV